jgi:hypothetical protein
MVSTDVVDEAGKRATLRNFFIRIKVRILILSMLFIDLLLRIRSSPKECVPGDGVY